MSITSILFNIGATKSDRKRDSKIPFPAGVKEWNNISYGPYGKSNLLDVYAPADKTNCPIIINVHGGGYVYGSKEIYRRYGMDMARRGFAFVNFNYRLAPKWRFPTPLWDTNSVMEWICKNAARYHLDPKRIIIVGDSAGAQLASQYAAIEALRNGDEAVAAAYQRYLDARVEVYGEEKASKRPQTLMDIATIGAKTLKKSMPVPSRWKSRRKTARNPGCCSLRTKPTTIPQRSSLSAVLLLVLVVVSVIRYPAVPMSIRQCA